MRGADRDERREPTREDWLAYEQKKRALRERASTAAQYDRGIRIVLWELRL